jgi:KTSC domain-containing protein
MSAISRSHQPGAVKVVTWWERVILTFRASLLRKGALKMNRTAIASPGIAQVGYEEGSEILEIEFASGKIFQFFNVPLNLFNQLMDSSHKERYYETNILERFPYKRIE